jgi:hypothetical protein
MLTPKEKARELFDKMFNIPDEGFGSIGVYEAKQCALIAVDEIIETCLAIIQLYEENGFINSDLSIQPIDYWQEVKQEIEKL